jgi:hypothetical protein
VLMQLASATGEDMGDIRGLALELLLSIAEGAVMRRIMVMMMMMMSVIPIMIL